MGAFGCLLSILGNAAVHGRCNAGQGEESLSAGLTEESLEAVVGGLEHSIREALKFRTSVSVSWAKLVIIAKEAMKRS